MPIWLKSGSMPNVLASSGMMGTMRSPIPLSLRSLESMRANAIVVDTSALEPPRNSSKGSLSSSGIGRA
jgi:hypothetical protein